MERHNLLQPSGGNEAKGEQILNENEDTHNAESSHPASGADNGTGTSPGFTATSARADNSEDYTIHDNMGISVIDYSSLTRNELVNKFKQLLSESEIENLKNEVENIRINFYKKHKAGNEEKRKKFIEAGGNIEEYQISSDPLEEEFNDLYKGYREQRNEITKTIEEQKKSNLAVKEEIIESIKELINKPESLQNTFAEFNMLQEKWRNHGLVPQSEMRRLYEAFNFSVQSFYDWVKLNNEARDLDFKRNLEAKIELCERAETLIFESDVRKAFGELQILHERWGETGPVVPEKRKEIWERFHDATVKIHKNHQEFFIKKKEEYEGNLQAKTLLCEKAEETASKVYTRFRDWEKATNDFIELQQVWKTIGMVPKSENAGIFRRFRVANDRFFEAKKEYMKTVSEGENNNLQRKTDLCIRAESLKESTDWKKTADEIMWLQKEWKRIGPVPRKVSDKIWTRFRTACNEFFERKTKHFDSLEGLLEDNVKIKMQIIEKLQNFESTGDNKNDLLTLKKLQKEWIEIGHIPPDKRKELQELFRKSVNHVFDILNLDDKKRESTRFRMYVDDLLEKPDSGEVIIRERESLSKKLRQVEADLKVLENNIGFFSKSNKTEALLKDFVIKIEAGKKEAEIIKEQIRYLDSVKKS